MEIKTNPWNERKETTMKISFLPKTKLGKWSVFLFVFFILSWIIPLSTADMGLEPGSLPKEPTFLMMLSGILTGLGILAVMASFLVGLISFILKKERSVLVFLVTLFSLFLSAIFILFLGEGFIG